MKRLAYFRNVNGSYTEHPFERSGEIPSNTEAAALMMERPDVDIKIVKLPPIRGDEVQTMLKYKLRSLYPGSPEKTVFDYRLVSDGGQKHAVLFIMNRDVLEEYRRKAGGKPLFLPYSLVQPLSQHYKDEHRAFLFVHESWAEMLFFNGGVIASSTVVRRENDLRLTMKKAAKLFPGDKPNHPCIVVCSHVELGEVKSAIAAAFDNAGSFEYLHPSAVFNLMRGRMDFLFFLRRRKAALLSRWSFALLLTVSCFLLVLVFDKTVASQRRRFDMLSGQIRTLQAERIETIALKEEVDKLEKRWAELQGKKPINAYRVLSELSNIFDKDMRITHFVIDGGAFQIDATGQNPLYLMEKFGENGALRDVKLIQSVPINGTFKERFRVIGNAKTN
jgi:hypothetical protein